MANYKCCNCSNILPTQGPINSMISYGGGNFSSPITLSDEGTSPSVNEDSLNNVFPKFPGNDFSISAKDKLPGSLDTFSFKVDIQTFQTRGGFNNFSQSVTIHCDNCGSICSFNI